MSSTPVPKKQLFILSVIIFTEPMDLVFLYPFVYFMVEGFNITSDPDKIGLFVGILSCSFPASQFVTSFFWGFLSDRLGRKPVILLSVTGSALCMIGFGFATSYWMALGFRISAGLLNCTMGIAKSTVAELTDDSNRSAGFSMIGFVTGLGFMIGPAIGGFLSAPAHQYPSVFGNVEFFLRFPYILPCILTASISLFGAVVGLFFMEETLPSKIKRDANWPLKSDFIRTKPNTKETISKLFSPVVVGCIAAYGMICFATNILDEAFSIWAASPTSQNGLAFSSPEVGGTLIFSGVVLLLSQLFLYPVFAKYFKALGNYRWSILLSAPVFISYPTLSYYVQQEQEGGSTGLLEFLLWAQLLLLVTLRTIFAVTAFTGSMIMISNCVTEEFLGSVNGLGQMVASAFRASGPIVAGGLWSWSLKQGLPFPFNHYFVFLVGASMCIIGFAVSLCLPRSINMPKKFTPREDFFANDAELNFLVQ